MCVNRQNELPKILNSQHRLEECFKAFSSNTVEKLLFLLCEKCPYSEFFWSVFSRIRTEYGETRSISPYSVQMRGNKDQKKSEYGHFSRSVIVKNENIKATSVAVVIQFFTTDVY